MLARSCDPVPAYCSCRSPISLILFTHNLTQSSHRFPHSTSISGLSHAKHSSFHHYGTHFADHAKFTHYNPFLFHTVPLSFNSTKAVPQFLFLLVFNCIKSYLGIGEKWTPKWCKRDDKEQKGKGMVKILVLVLGDYAGMTREMRACI